MTMRFASKVWLLAILCFSLTAFGDVIRPPLPGGIVITGGTPGSQKIVWDNVNSRFDFHDSVITVGASAVNFSQSATFSAGATVASGQTFTMNGATLSGTIAGAPTWASTQTLNTSGNAGTATTLATVRTLWGVNFNGGANVTAAPTFGAGASVSSGQYITLTGSTANRALILNGSSQIEQSTTTATQLQYLNSATGTTGITSSNLVFSASPTLTGTAAMADANVSGTLQMGAASTLAFTTGGQISGTIAGTPTWSAINTYSAGIKITGGTAATEIIARTAAGTLDINNGAIIVTGTGAINGNIASRMASIIATIPTNPTLWETGPAGPGSNAFEGGVLLPNGKVFAIPLNYTGTNTIYNPSTNAWETGPAGPGGGAFVGGVLLPNGKVFAISHSYTGTSTIYNPSTNAWETGPAGPGGGAFVGGVLLPNGKVFAIPFTYTGTNTIYNPVVTGWPYGQWMLHAMFNKL